MVVRTSPLENDKAIGFLSTTGPDSLGHHKATKPAFNVGKAKRHLNDGPLLVVLDPFFPHQLRIQQPKKVVRVYLDPLLQKFLDPRMFQVLGT